MPTTLHPQAKFDPIPPDLDIHGLVDRSPNFKWVQRVSWTQIRNLGQQEFEKLVLIHVIVGGKPLVIDGWDTVLPQSLFQIDWLEKTYDKKQENVRDISAGGDIPMTMGHYVRSMKQLTNQWTPNNFRDERRQRLYLKDIDCPIEWQDALRKIIHPSLFYLNENVSTNGEVKTHDDDMFRTETTAAPAGDLMSSLPEDMRAQNLMCYIGHEGTYTPAHREMCASLGQNIMVEASGDQNGEKPGSSIWFMTESKDREVVREYFLSMLGHDIEIEKHFAQINAWKKAPFDVYIVDQRAGDFIIIPPLAAHQVWNRGTRTMKVAWNRTTPETLDLALHEALPKARLVCRDEQYKNKAIIYFTLQKYYDELIRTERKAEMTQMSFMGIGQDIVRSSPRVKQLAGDFKKLFGLFTEILVDEIFAFKEKTVELIAFDSCITCSYCRSNIFNRFLTCKHCVRTLVGGDEDTYDICMECYAMGRSCACLSGLQWCEQWSWSELVTSYETWRAMVILNDGFVDLKTSPHPLEVARQQAQKKSLAQICQEALRRRPWKDITKPDLEKTPSDSEREEGDEKPKKKPKRKKKKGELRRCHVCSHKDYSYRVHQCTNPECSEGYCYGVLYRAFDMMPQKVMEDEHWQCPKCLGICNCGHCRRTGNMTAYTPKNTSLGHDTRPIADDRSVEALVDFRIHNLSWLKATGEESRSKDSRRMQRLRQQADNAKAQDLTEQAEAERTMQHDADLSDMVPTEHPNEYEDQTHAMGGEEPVAEQYSAVGSIDNPINGVASRGEDLEQSVSSRAEDGEIDSSAYPDPSAFARQRIGMGYYEQDDTPDKILFDPYQAPSADSLQLMERDVPEGVKKSIRAAKRKARRDNEDPDFVVGKSHHKRPRPASEAHTLDTMDPALFGEASPPPGDSIQSSLHKQHHSLPEEDTTQQLGEITEYAERPVQKRPHAVRFDANEPMLRHAKPLTSYVEAEDADLALDNDEAAPETGLSEEPLTPALVGQDAIDLAADNILSIFGQTKQPEPDVNTSLPDQEKVIRRRGRPPRQLPTPTQLAGTLSTNDSHAGEGISDTAAKRSRAAPNSRNSLPTFAEDGDEEPPHGIRETRSSQMATLRTAPEPLSEGTSQLRRGRGRPRKTGVTTIAAASIAAAAAAASDMDSGSETFPNYSMTTTSTGHTPTIRPSRGRPPRGRPSRGRPSRGREPTRGEQKTPALPDTEKPENVQFMSMAERMALRGKSFKIGKRKSAGVSKSTTGVLKHSQIPTPNHPAGESGERQLSPEEPPKAFTATMAHSTGHKADGLPSRDESSHKTGAENISGSSLQGGRGSAYKPTIVSLADVDQEIADASAVTSSSDDSSNEEDIPPRRVPSIARGVVNGLRGVRRGRGRPRGRAAQRRA